MLVLTRREGERLLIGKDIRVTVLIIFEKRTKLRIQDAEDKTMYIRKTRSITLGDDITVTVVDIDQKQIKLGIKALKDVTINREEVPKED